MPLFHETLYHLRGRVLNAKPNAKPESVRMWLNDAIRDVINARTYWADLLVLNVLSVPLLTTSGSVSTTLGSSVLTGSLTNWPVGDVVNTTLSQAVIDTGNQEAVPVSMNGITDDSILWIDIGALAEAVPVYKAGSTSFIGKFQFTHAVGAPVLQS